MPEERAKNDSICRPRRRTLLAAALSSALVSIGALAASPRVVHAQPASLKIGIIGTNRYGSGDPAYVGRLRDTLAAFARLGGRVIDTAPAYGDSERVIGAILGETGLREQLFLATKVGHDSAADGRNSIAASFEAMRTRRLDLVQLHNLRGGRHGARGTARAAGGRLPDATMRQTIARYFDAI